ncbi:hypothetical protein FLONG3_7751 [Fusarium longipes]|uniref:Uncharacterized protein n=1 Tax=Fusarium longipes TaxID=694270 RepID=A0A395SAK5_9HYPO|nr:hypothetical protein FLONG3_7751 [Fusarium longipes]
MKSLSLISLFCTLVTAAVIPRETVFDGHCCFTLHDVASGATVQENGNGNLLLNAGATPGFFCIDTSSSQPALRDSAFNSCFMNSSGEIKCIDPTPAFDSWKLKKSGSNTLLHRDDESTFNSCTKTSTSAKGTVLFSGPKHTGASKCNKVTLKAKNLKGTCKNF